MSDPNIPLSYNEQPLAEGMDVYSVQIVDSFTKLRACRVVELHPPKMITVAFESEGEVVTTKINSNTVHTDPKELLEIHLEFINEQIENLPKKADFIQKQIDELNEEFPPSYIEVTDEDEEI